METFLDHYLREYRGKLLFRSNLKQQDSTLLNVKDPFFKEIIQYWTKFNYKDNNLDFASTYIWYDSHIRIENRPFFYRSWLSAGIKGIRDLLDNDQNPFCGEGMDIFWDRIVIFEERYLICCMRNLFSLSNHYEYYGQAMWGQRMELKSIGVTKSVGPIACQVIGLHYCILGSRCLTSCWQNPNWLPRKTHFMNQ